MCAMCMYIHKGRHLGYFQHGFVVVQNREDIKITVLE